jgi:hypothetical protein
MIDDMRSVNAIREDIGKPADVSRRSLLRGATIVAGGAVVLASAMTANRADAAKMSQAAAAYQPSPKSGQRCDGCALYDPPASCKLVDGAISPAGWCKFYQKKSS